MAPAVRQPGPAGRLCDRRAPEPAAGVAAGLRLPHLPAGRHRPGRLRCRRRPAVAGGGARRPGRQLAGALGQLHPLHPGATGVRRGHHRRRHLPGMGRQCRVPPLYRSGHRLRARCGALRPAGRRRHVHQQHRGAGRPRAGGPAAGRHHRWRLAGLVDGRLHRHPAGRAADLDRHRPSARTVVAPAVAGWPAIAAVHRRLHRHLPASRPLGEQSADADVPPQGAADRRPAASAVQRARTLCLRHGQGAR